MQKNEREETVKLLLDACFSAKRLTESLPKLPEGMKVSHNRILEIIGIAQQEERLLKISELAKEMNVTKPSITRLVNELEEKGLVVKKDDQNDSRASRLYLSHKGKEYVETYIQNFHKQWAENLSDLDLDDARNFMEILKRFKKAMPEKIG